MTYGREGIYLDHAATTPVDPGVVERMMPYFSQQFGNPSSIYHLGQEARAAIDGARRQCASVLGCAPGEVLLTSGATESDTPARKHEEPIVLHSATRTRLPLRLRHRQNADVCR